jgi:hypothetical protein
MSTYSQGSFDRASPTKFNAWRTVAMAFSNISAYRFTTVSVTAGDEPEQVAAGQVSADFFVLFGASTIQGRTFSADEDRPNGGHVVVLSCGYWQRRFGGDSRLVGNTLSIGAFDIVGRPSTGPAGVGGWVTASPGISMHSRFRCDEAVSSMSAIRARRPWSS